MKITEISDKKLTKAGETALHRASAHREQAVKRKERGEDKVFVKSSNKSAKKHLDRASKLFKYRDKENRYETKKMKERNITELTASLAKMASKKASDIADKYDSNLSKDVYSGNKAKKRARKIIDKKNVQHRKFARYKPTTKEEVENMENLNYKWDELLEFNDSQLDEFISVLNTEEDFKELIEDISFFIGDEKTKYQENVTEIFASDEYLSEQNHEDAVRNMMINWEKGDYTSAQKDFNTVASRKVKKAIEILEPKVAKEMFHVKHSEEENLSEDWKGDIKTFKGLAKKVFERICAKAEDGWSFKYGGTEPDLLKNLLDSMSQLNSMMADDNMRNQPKKKY